MAANPWVRDRPTADDWMTRLGHSCSYFSILTLYSCTNYDNRTQIVSCYRGFLHDYNSGFCTRSMHSDVPASQVGVSPVTSRGCR